MRLCGLKLKASSRQVSFVPTNEEDTKMNQPIKQIHETSDTAYTSIWMPTIHERYCARPKTVYFDKICQAAFVSKFRIISQSELKSANKDNLYKLQDNLGYILKRSKSSPAVTR